MGRTQTGCRVMAWHCVLMDRGGKTSLFQLLTVLFVAQIVAVAGLIGYLSYRNGQNAVAEMANHLMAEIGRRTEENLAGYMQNNEEITAANVALVESGRLDFTDMEGLKRHFWDQLHTYPLASTVAMFGDHPSMLALERDDSSFILREYDKHKRTLSSYRLDANAQKTELTGKLEDFDPLKDPPDDPFYGKTRQGPYWTLVVTLPKGVEKPELMIVHFRPIFDARHAMIGIAASSMYLSQFGRFLTSLKIGRSGQAIVIDRQGNLIATSTGEIPFRARGDAGYAETAKIENRRIAALESRDPVTAGAARFVLQRFGGFDRIGKSAQFNFQMQKMRYLGLINPLRKSNLDWLEIIVVPEMDFMRHIRRNARNNILFSFAALLAAMAIGVLTARWVTSPVMRINAAAGRLARGDWDEPAPVMRSDEIGELARSFNSMAAQLKSSFEGLESEIAERKRAEQELTFRNIMLTTQQETSMDGILVVDESDRVIAYNRRFVDLWEIPAELIAARIDTPLLAYVAGNLVDPEGFVERVKYLYAHPDEKSREEIVLKDGRVFDRYSAPMSGPDGKYYGRVWYFRNITARKRAEEAILKLNTTLERRVAERTAQLELTNKELEAFTYSVSHDLRAPLRAIDGFSRFLADDYQDKLDDEGRRLIHVIRSNTQKMDLLITNLLSFSRIARSEISYSRIDMRAMADSMYHEAAAQDVRESFRTIIQPLSDAWGDAALMRQVWANLIGNAVKYSMKSSVRSIEIGGYTADAEHVYFVKDRGVGFNPEYAHKLFGVFQRLHTSEDFEGTGIGLAIVQRIVHRHKGRVWAEGQENAGATFYFTLPIKEER